MAIIPPKNPITRFLNRIPFQGLWFDWFAGSPLTKLKAGVLIGICVIALLCFDLIWAFIRAIWVDLSVDTIQDFVQKIFS